MINVNQITAQLAQMPDQALQQFAAMHKNDPYTVSLALSESNRRKQMRTASQMPQGGEPPKVVDQELAQMAAPQMAQAMPEDTGIGALPAGDMNFADGGIVGFADGGVPGYAAELGAPLVRMPNESFADFRRRTFDAELRRQQAANAAEAQAREAERVRRVAARGEAGTIPPSPFFDRAPFAALTPSGVSAPAVSDVYPSETMRGAATMPPPEMTASTRAPTPPGPPAPSAQNRALPETEEGITRLLAPRAPGAAAAGRTTAQRYADIQEAAGAGSESRETLDTRYKEQADAMRTAAREEDVALEKEIEARGVAGKGKEERISKREAGLGRQKEELTGLALLEAGLAIMSTPGGLATAIGKGAQTGLKTYGAGLEKLRSAQEKMDEARDQLEEFRRNEANMTAKERRLSKNAINRTEVDAAKLGVEAAEKMYGYNREDAKSIFTASTQEKIAGMQIASAAGIAKLQGDRAVMADERADTRARLSAAQTLMKEAGDMLSGPSASLLDEKTKATYLEDYNSAKATLQKLGGIAAAPIATPTAPPGWGQPRVIK